MFPLFQNNFDTLVSLLKFNLFPCRKKKINHPI